MSRSGQYSNIDLPFTLLDLVCLRFIYSEFVTMHTLKCEKDSLYNLHITLLNFVFVDCSLYIGNNIKNIPLSKNFDP